MGKLSRKKAARRAGRTTRPKRTDGGKPNPHAKWFPVRMGIRKLLRAKPPKRSKYLPAESTG